METSRIMSYMYKDSLDIQVLMHYCVLSLSRGTETLIYSVLGCVPDNTKLLGLECMSNDSVSQVTNFNFYIWMPK